MSKLLDFMERISDSSSAPLGFGAARSANLPGMALVALVADDHQSGVAAAAAAGLDAAILHGVSGSDRLKDLGESISGIPWGAYVAALSEEEAQACRDGGGDLVAFTLEGTAAAVTGEDDLARVLFVATGLDDRELRAIAALPVDIFALDMNAVAGPWTLQDLVKVGSISRRGDKYILVEVSQAPDKKDLEALRDMGVSGLLVNPGVVGLEALAGLKMALQEMPRPSSRSRERSRRRERLRATLPVSSFAPASPPPQEDDDEDDYD